VSDWWPRRIPAQPLELLSAALRDAHRGVQRETVVLGREPPTRQRLLPAAAPGPFVVRAGPRSVRGAALDGRRAELLLQRWFVRTGIVGRHVVLPRGHLAVPCPRGGGMLDEGVVSE
jgi:hypothetical protein